MGFLAVHPAASYVTGQASSRTKGPGFPERDDVMVLLLLVLILFIHLCRCSLLTVACPFEGFLILPTELQSQAQRQQKGNQKLQKAAKGCWSLKTKCIDN